MCFSTASKQTLKISVPTQHFSLQKLINPTPVTIRARLDHTSIIQWRFMCLMVSKILNELLQLSVSNNNITYRFCINCKNNLFCPNNTHVHTAFQLWVSVCVKINFSSLQNSIEKLKINGSVNFILNFFVSVIYY